MLENWEEIKKKEKESRNTITSPLQEIPKELPALTKAVKVSKKVDKLYKPMPDYLTSVKALQEALNQLEKLAPDNENTAIAKEVGDILMSVSNISRICKLSSEQILSDRIEDMIEQYEKV